MPYQTFGFVQKNFTDTEKRVPLDMMLSTKKNDDLDSRQKNIIAEMYRAVLRYTNLQIQQRTSSIKASKIKDMEYKLESKLFSLNARLKTIDEEYQANVGLSDISLYSDDLFENPPSPDDC